MAITIIVENGDVVDGANSFVTYADAVIIGEQLGLSISSTESEGASQLTQAYFQMVRSYQGRLKGSIVSQTQTGVAPRNNLYAKGFFVPSDSIPVDFINAQLAYADSINRGADLNQTAKGQEVSSESLDGVGSKTYKSGSSSRTTPLVPAVTQWLQPYMKSNGLTRDDYFYDGKGSGYGGRYGC